MPEEMPASLQLLVRLKREEKIRQKFRQYDKTVSYATFPAEQARFFIKDPEEWENLKNIIILEIYYTSLDYTKIKHLTSYTMSSFVAQLGGKVRDKSTF